MKASYLAAATSVLLSSACVDAQTYSKCNPLTSGNCPPDPALGKSETFDFTKGASDGFMTQGNPTFDSNGASFTVAKSGDSPLIESKFYIMFGKLEVTMKAAPGAGIVSSVVLQSDVLDEIDWEWLGADPDQVQSNYFGKGQTTTYNRGAFHPDPGSQTSFKTYTIDWNSEQIVWQIDGKTVRALGQSEAASGQYPQTPMQVKVGSWSGGDSANPPGVIEWSEGPTDYSSGPYTMLVKSLTATDYSTGTQYKYNGQDGTWKSIVAVGGEVNPSGSGGGDGSPTEENPPTVSSASPSIPVPFEGTHRDTSSDYVKPSIYPWVAEPTTLQTAAATPTSYPGLPAGWSVSDSGKVIPPSSASAPSLPRSSSYASPSSQVSAAGGAAEVRTTFDEKGFPTLVTIVPGASQAPKQYDDKGFLITSAPAAAAAATSTPMGADLQQNDAQKASTGDELNGSSSPTENAAAASVIERLKTEGIVFSATCALLSVVIAMMAL